MILSFETLVFSDIESTQHNSEWLATRAHIEPQAAHT
jgi:hypothetical protein